MKQLTRSFLVLALACVLCSAITFLIAYHRGYKSGYGKGFDGGIASGRFTESLGLYNSLRILRTGDIPRATRSMEAECFASAKIYYNNPIPDLGKIELAKALSAYRAVYRTNSADWDDWERKLEIQLAKIKSDNEKAWNGIVIKPIDMTSNIVVTPSSPPR